jgi:hypothetical protein
LLDQHVDLAGLLGQSGNLVGIGQVGGEETGIAASFLDSCHGGRAAGGVTAVHDHAEAVAGQL